MSESSMVEPASGAAGLQAAPPSYSWVYSLFRSGLYAAGTLAFDLRAHHAERVPSEGGVLLLANHLSFLDPPFVGVKVRRQLSFLARDTLFVGVMGKILPKLNAHPVKRGRGDVAAMKQSIALLQAGHAMVVFPEGTRSEDGEMRPLASGMALLVKRARVPVVPVAIEGSYEAWNRHEKYPSSRPVDVMYGHPIDLCDLPAGEMIGRVESEIRSMIKSLRELRAMRRGV